MIVEYGAEFLPICFKTGLPAYRYVEVTAYWVPLWVYATALAAVLPYLFISPFFSQRVALKVPLSASAYQKFRAWAQLGLASYVLSGILLLAGFTLRNGMVFLCFALVMVFATIITSRPAYRLRFRFASGQLIVLRGIHPNCLVPLPEWTRELP